MELEEQARWKHLEFFAIACWPFCPIGGGASGRIRVRTLPTGLFASAVQGADRGKVFPGWRCAC